MKTLLLAAAFIISVGAQASDLIVVQAGLTHCRELDPTKTLTEKAQSKAEAKCVTITGYPNAKLIGEPVITGNITGWGSQGCSVIKTSSITAKYECLVGNK